MPKPADPVGAAIESGAALREYVLQWGWPHVRDQVLDLGWMTRDIRALADRYGLRVPARATRAALIAALDRNFA